MEYSPPSTADCSCSIYIRNKEMAIHCSTLLILFTFIIRAAILQDHSFTALIHNVIILLCYLMCTINSLESMALQIYTKENFFKNSYRKQCTREALQLKLHFVPACKNWRTASFSARIHKTQQLLSDLIHWSSQEQEAELCRTRCIRNMRQSMAEKTTDILNKLPEQQHPIM